jgi:tRNA1(Val) A37 N6-methylase TrmN6
MTLVESKIFCQPSESLYHSKPFLTKYENHFDLVFFSPPYYRLELYKGGAQSTDEYESYEVWLEKYWKQTIELCHHVLIKGGKMCYILSGYGSETTAEQYNLLTDMNRITQNYFKLVSRQPMLNKNVNVTQHRETGETIMVFTK